DTEPIEAYLDRYLDRFDLLHPETPFFQVARLTATSREVGEVVRLIADVPNRDGFRHFATRSADGVTVLSFAEAARWLVHSQAFDTGGTKSGTNGDPRVIRGKCYSSGAAENGIAWCGNLGLVVIEGASLFETLLLNLPLPVVVASADSATWEVLDREPWEFSAPNGPAELLTWQSRQIRLVGGEGQVTGVVLTYGRSLDPVNRFQHEWMTSWRVVPSDSKSDRRALPVKHDPNKAIWRGLASLLSLTPDQQQTPPARWSEWLARLHADGLLQSETALRLRAVGLSYGPSRGPGKNATVGGSTDDLLDLPIEVIEKQWLTALAVDAVQDVDNAVRALGTLAAELAEAAGASGDVPQNARAAARERGYAALDLPYRSWLRMLRSDSARDEVRPEWQRTVSGVVVGIGGSLVRGAGPAAWIGREVPRGSGTVYLDAAVAEICFHHRLRTTFNSALSSGRQEDSNDHRRNN
ncbi:MAG: type I-E CRISPR-associated protein Cse1/CasA, partial [Solirubrobacteraceae bacterium]